ncbi:MAG: universal stress protein [Bacteroidetes bacterium]|nr:MAG: universal stress protein [Bacteroidota bacterium]
MNTKYKILLATDYSEAVMNAERYAVQFAKATNSILVFLHIYDTPLPPPKITMSYKDMLVNTKAFEIEKLENHREKLFQTLNIKPGGIAGECIVREGLAGKQIRKEAKETDADFIIVGTHGATGFREVFFGSHSWDVIKKSSVPVIAVPKEALFTGFKNIVFGTEYREGEIPVLNFLTKFAKHFDAEVTVLHSTNYVLSKHFEKDMFERFRNDIKGKVVYDKIKIELIKSGNVVDGLNRFCERTKADLLVMSPQQPYLLEKIFTPDPSMTKKMSFHATTPLMTIPDFYNPEYIDFWKHFAQGDYVNEDF